MKRALLFGLALWVVTLLAMRDRKSTRAEVAPVRPLTTAPSEATAPLAPLPDPPKRNIFEYAPETPIRPVPVLRSQPSPDSAATAVSAPPVDRLRLVGLLFRSNQVVATLAKGDEVILAGVGQEAFGNVVVAIDEEQGVRLRRPDGTELRLQPDP